MLGLRHLCRWLSCTGLLGPSVTETPWNGVWQGLSEVTLPLGESLLHKRRNKVSEIPAYNVYIYGIMC